MIRSLSCLVILLIGIAVAVPDAQAVAPTLDDWGCLSLGKPSYGWLVNGVRLPSSDKIQVRERSNYATKETVAAIQRAVDKVHAEFPDTYTLVVGNLSRKGGGRLRPHRSHRNGRDADIGYFMKQERSPTYFKKVTRNTLDAARTWTLLESFLDDGELEYAFVHWRLQKPLYDYAKNVRKLSDAELQRIFQYPRKRSQRVGIIRHSRGHLDHLHVRFHSRESVANGHNYLEKHPEAIEPLPVHHRVRKGDNLSRIARRYAVKISELRKWNRIPRKSRKRARRLLRIGKTLIVGWKRPVF